MEQFISAETIAEGIPARLKAFLYPDSPPLPMVAMPVVEAFWEAAVLIEKVARLDKKVVIIFFGGRPFKVNLRNGALTYAPNDNVICAHINDVIYIDCSRLLSMDRRIKVACILEELAHAFLNISDEDLVTNVVGWLHDGVEIKDGKYALPEGV